jgi:hypothetical protein
MARPDGRCDGSTRAYCTAATEAWVGGRFIASKPLILLDFCCLNVMARNMLVHGVLALAMVIHRPIQ